MPYMISEARKHTVVCCLGHAVARYMRRMQVQDIRTPSVRLIGREQLQERQASIRTIHSQKRLATGEAGHASSFAQPAVSCSSQLQCTSTSFSAEYCSGDVRGPSEQQAFESSIALRVSPDPDAMQPACNLSMLALWLTRHRVNLEHVCSRHSPSEGAQLQALLARPQVVSPALSSRPSFRCQLSYVYGCNAVNLLRPAWF